jgi:enoyl-CoA hydratase/carnithine racemase
VTATRLTERVRLDVTEGVAVAVVDNPPVNALTNETVDALTEIALHVRTDPTVRVVILTGAGDKAFAAGADLDEFSQALGNTAWIEDHTSRTRRMLSTWEHLPIPVVAAVQASAVGGGLELALVCDLIVADMTARFGLPEVRLGLMPGAGGTQRLPQRVGVGAAKELLLLGNTIDAGEAHRIGLVNRVTSAGEALAEARALAAKLAALPALSVRAIKASVDGAAENGALSAGLDRERELFIELFASADAREGVSAFVEKRQPNFEHR